MPYSGTMRGKIECYFNTGDYGLNVQNSWTSLWKFLVHHPRFHEIACHRGLGSTYDTVGPIVGGSDGTQDDIRNYVNYNDQGTSFGDGAWSLFKWDHGGSSTRSYDRYVLLQYARTNSMQTQAWTVPTLANGQGAFGSLSCITMATAIVDTSLSGSTSPMALSGTFSQQSKGSPVWVLPGGASNLWVFPRSNDGAPGVGGYAGNHVSLKENTSIILAQQSASPQQPCRMNVMCDDDALIMFNEPSNDGTYTSFYYGLYVPRTGLSVQYPEVMWSMINGIPFSTGGDAGNIAGTTSAAGGILLRDSSSGVRNFSIDRLNYLMNPGSIDSNQHPNKLTATAQYDEYPINLYARESPSIYGFAGQIDWLREIYGVNSNDLSLDQTRAFFGANYATSVKLVAPWVGSSSPGPVVPGTGTTRTGISFP